MTFTRPPRPSKFHTWCRESRTWLTRKQVEQHWQAVEAQVFGALSEQERETLSRLLERVREKLVRLHEGRAGGTPL